MWIRGCCLSVVVFLGVASGLLAIEHTTDSVDVMRANLNEGRAVLFDVREEEEWKAGHLSQAKLVPLSLLKTGANLADVKTLATGKIVYCHCRSGKRSLVAGEILKTAGYDVRPLKAGYEDLLGQGFTKATTGGNFE